jgi:hypothetical protein
MGLGLGTTYNTTVWRDAGEEYEHAVCANVGFGIGVAHGQSVDGFGEEFVSEEVVS